MSGCNFIVKKKGLSVQDAYRAAVEDAEFEHGHEEGYSGAINSAGTPVDYTKKFKESGQPLSKYINFILENAYKRDCYSICISEPKQNPNKVQSKVEHIITPGTKRWVLKYAVWNLDNKLKSCDTKGEAVVYARKYVEKTHGMVGIYMEKVLQGDVSSCVAMVSYKKSKEERLGEWIFFGIAPD